MQVLFDIETVRQYKTLNESPAEVQTAWANHSKRYYPEMIYGESYEKWASLKPEFAKVVCISAMDSETKTIADFYGAENDPENMEHALLKSFADRVTGRGEWSAATFIGHAIKKFDIPFLVTRFLAYEIPVPDCFKFYGKKPWEITNIVDTVEVWKGGQYQTCNAANLECVCLLLGIPSPKDDISGAEVGDVYYSGDPDALQRIVTYCGKDVDRNAKVYNAMHKLNMI